MKGSGSLRPLTRLVTHKYLAASQYPGALGWWALEGTKGKSVTEYSVHKHDSANPRISLIGTT